MARPVQGQAPPWGNDLNAWLDVAHNADGTTKPAVGSSVLWAGAELAGQASGTYPSSLSGGFEWVQGFMGATALPASSGSDIAINGGDTKLIDILTDSWVRGLLQVTFVLETAGDTATFCEAGWGPDFFNSSVWPTQFFAGTTEASDPGGTVCVPMPTVFLPAGTQIQNFIGCYVSNPAHTWRTIAWLQLEKVG